MSLLNALKNLATLLAGMDDITDVSASPPFSISDFPYGLVYVDDGEMAAISQGLSRGLHNLAFELHVSRSVTPDAVLSASVWPERVFAIIQTDTTLGGAISHVVWPMHYEASPIAYGNEIHYGIKFTIKVKIQ